MLYAAVVKIKHIAVTFQNGMQKVNFTLQDAIKTQNRCRGIALTILSTMAQNGVSGQHHARPLYLWERRPSTHSIQKEWWASGPVWTSHPNQDLNPDHPACNESLYQLCCPDHPKCYALRTLIHTWIDRSFSLLKNWMWLIQGHDIERWNIFKKAINFLVRKFS